jgi:hypothetical protein
LLLWLVVAIVGIVMVLLLLLVVVLDTLVSEPESSPIF